MNWFRSCCATQEALNIGDFEVIQEPVVTDFKTSTQVDECPSSVSIGRIDSTGSAMLEAKEEKKAKPVISQLTGDDPLEPQKSAESRVSLEDTSSSTSAPSDNESCYDEEFPETPITGQEQLDKIMSLYDAGKFHLAVDELELGPKVTFPKVTEDVKTKLKILEELSGSWKAVKEHLPKAMVRAMSVFPRGPLRPSEMKQIMGVRRAQTRLDSDLPPKEELEKEGWVDVGCVETGVNAWCRIDRQLKRTFVIADTILNFSALDLLPLLMELQFAHLWVPLCQKSEWIHDFPGKDEVKNVRLLHQVIKPPVVQIDLLFAAALEDRLEECNCMIVNIFPLPQDKIMDKNGFQWLGADVPGPTPGWSSFRLPTDCARMCIFPQGRNRCRVLNYQCLVDVVTPVPWIVHLIFRTLSKKMIPQMEETIRNIKGSPIETAAQSHPQQYDFWNKKILDYWEKRGI